MRARRGTLEAKMVDWDFSTQQLPREKELSNSCLEDIHFLCLKRLHGGREIRAHDHQQLKSVRHRHMLRHESVGLLVKG